MKEIMAIIRINKMNQTKTALVRAGIASFTACKVAGRGKGKVDYHLLKGAEAGCEEAIIQLGSGPKLLPKRMLSIVVPDDLASSVVRTIIEVNQAGHPGDGKIFVLPVDDVVRVRTDERGDEALDESR